MLLVTHSSSSQDAQRADDTSEKQAGVDRSPADRDDLAIDAPARSRPDEPIAVRITGAEPGAPVEFAATIREATTPVEEIDGPVCLVSGGGDPIWPASRLAEIGIDRLDRAGFGHGYEHRRYDDAGHFITPPYLPKSDEIFGCPAAAMARADVDAWPAALDTLAAGLDPISGTD
jgi:hypothetical protein